MSFEDQILQIIDNAQTILPASCAGGHSGSMISCRRSNGRIIQAQCWGDVPPGAVTLVFAGNAWRAIASGTAQIGERQAVFRRVRGDLFNLAGDVFVDILPEPEPDDPPETGTPSFNVGGWAPEGGTGGFEYNPNASYTADDTPPPDGEPPSEGTWIEEEDTEDDPIVQITSEIAVAGGTLIRSMIVQGGSVLLKYSGFRPSAQFGEHPGIEARTLYEAGLEGSYFRQSDSVLYHIDADMLQQSTDAGTTWTDAPTQPTTQYDDAFYSYIGSANRTEVLWASGGRASSEYFVDLEILVSSDAANTWQRTTFVNPGEDPVDYSYQVWQARLAAAGHEGRWAIASDEAVWVRESGAWTNTGITITPTTDGPDYIKGIAWVGSALIVLTRYCRAYRWAGGAWTDQDTPLTSLSTNDINTRLVAAVGAASEVLAITSDARLLRSADAGVSWQQFTI